MKQLIAELDEVDINKNDLQSLALSIMYEIEGNSAQHARAKIEALKLLSELMADEQGKTDMSEDDVLRVLQGGKAKSA